MSKAAQRVIDTFEALPEDDQRVVLVEILRRTRAVEDYPPLSDAELVLAADQVFLELDRRGEQV